MKFFLTGSSASGKSALAEALAAALAREKNSPLVYLATMSARDPRSLRRVARHRAQRAGKGFETIERPLALASLPLPAGAAVLLEDLGNLCANEFFAPGGGGEAALLAGLESLFSRVDDLVVVGNEVFSDGAAWGPEMTGYLTALARAQRACAAWADAAGEVSSGAVTWHKRPAGRSALFWTEVSPG